MDPDFFVFRLEWPGGAGHRKTQVCLAKAAQEQSGPF